MKLHSLRNLLLACLILLTCSCKERILHDLDEIQANQVRLILSRSGIAVSKVKDGPSWSIDVPDSSVNEALTLLENNRVLRKVLPVIEEKTNGIIQSSEEKAFFLERALSKNLEQTIERFPEVLEARVHISIQAKDVLGFSDHKKSETASVLVIVENSNSIDDKKIKKLVAGASGIASEFVSVIVETQPANFNYSNKLRSSSGQVEQVESYSEQQSPSIVTSQSLISGMSFLKSKWLLVSVFLFVLALLILKIATRPKISSERKLAPINPKRKRDFAIKSNPAMANELE